MQGIATTLSSWKLADGDVEIIKKPNGRPTVLGEGGYGKVRLQMFFTTARHLMLCACAITTYCTCTSEDSFECCPACERLHMNLCNSPALKHVQTLCDLSMYALSLMTMAASLSEKSDSSRPQEHFQHYTLCMSFPLLVSSATDMAHIE